jgi:hypothetical protein
MRFGQKLELFFSVWVVGLLLTGAFAGFFAATDGSVQGVLVGLGIALLVCSPFFVLRLFQIWRSLRRTRSAANEF